MRKLLIILFLLQLQFAFCAPAEAKDYNLLLADHTQRQLFIRSSEREIVWKHPGTALFEAWMQKDGSIIYSTKQTVERIFPDLKAGTGGKVVWIYKFGTGSKEKPLPAGMIYGCTPLSNGNFMITESGTFRLVEINKKGKVVNTITLPTPETELRYSLRLTRETERNTYLVPYFGEGKLIEFDQSGKKLKEINVGQHCQSPETSAYEAIPLKDGKLLISCGPQNQVIILGKNEKVEWRLTAKDLPEDMNFYWTTKLVPLKNGNIIVCNYCKGEPEIKAFEITPEKKIVWKLTDPRIKGLTTLQLLTNDYKPLNP